MYKYEDTCYGRASEESRGGSNSLVLYVVRLAGFEPATYGLEVRCSIHLSYRRLNQAD